MKKQNDRNGNWRFLYPFVVKTRHINWLAESDVFISASFVSNDMFFVKNEYVVMEIVIKNRAIIFAAC